MRSPIFIPLSSKSSKLTVAYLLDAAPEKLSDTVKAKVRELERAALQKSEAVKEMRALLPEDEWEMGAEVDEVVVAFLQKEGGAIIDFDGHWPVPRAGVRKAVFEEKGVKGYCLITPQAWASRSAEAREELMKEAMENAEVKVIADSEGQKMEWTTYPRDNSSYYLDRDN